MNKQSIALCVLFGVLSGCVVKNEVTTVHQKIYDLDPALQPKSSWDISQMMIMSGEHNMACKFLTATLEELREAKLSLSAIKVTKDQFGKSYNDAQCKFQYDLP